MEVPLTKALANISYMEYLFGRSNPNLGFYPEAVRDEILTRDMLRIGLVVCSIEDDDKTIFPSPANYHSLVSSPYCDSRTH